MYGETWCQGDTNYCVQINKIKGKRNYNKVIKLMDDWSLTGEGVSGKQEYLLIFSKNFNSRDEWVLWGKGVDMFKLNAVNQKGSTLKYPKMGKQAKKTKTKKKK